MDKYAYEIRLIDDREWEDAIQLVWDTFLIYEAPEYSKEGINNFKNFIRDPMLKRMFLAGEYITYGAFINDTIVGVLAIRTASHVSLLFVQSEFHHRGIATALLRRYFREARRRGITTITVNSSPYATGFYHRIGFVDLSQAVLKDGIISTPMKLDFYEL